MKDNGILKTIKLSYVIISALECVLGLVMLFYPGFSLSAMGVILGVGLLVFGAVELVVYFTGNAPLLMSRNVLAMGIFFAVLGVIVIANPLELMNFICIMVGIGILAGSLFKIQTVLEARRYVSAGGWWLTFAALLLSAAAGIVLIFSPNASANVLVILLGISLLFNGVLNICDVTYISRYVKKAKDYYRNNFDYSDVVYDDSDDTHLDE